jgi:hypothetical protein
LDICQYQWFGQRQIAACHTASDKTSLSEKNSSQAELRKAGFNRLALPRESHLENRALSLELSKLAQASTLFPHRQGGRSILSRGKGASISAS